MFYTHNQDTKSVENEKLLKYYTFLLGTLKLLMFIY